MIPADDADKSGAGIGDVWGIGLKNYEGLLVSTLSTDAMTRRRWKELMGNVVRCAPCGGLSSSVANSCAVLLASNV